MSVKEFAPSSIAKLIFLLEHRSSRAMTLWTHYDENHERYSTFLLLRPPRLDNVRRQYDMTRFALAGLIPVSSKSSRDTTQVRDVDQLYKGPPTSTKSVHQPGKFYPLSDDIEQNTVLCSPRSSRLPSCVILRPLFRPKMVFLTLVSIVHRCQVSRASERDINSFDLPYRCLH
jgi:hypothetical protein